jgi:hypothetical protein
VNLFFMGELGMTKVLLDAAAGGGLGELDVDDGSDGTAGGAEGAGGT